MKQVSTYRKSVSIALSVLTLAGAALVTEVAFAATCVTGGSSEPSLQDVFNDITVNGSSSVNANNGCLPDGTDKTWGVTGDGGAVFTLVAELAGFADTNTFGIYDATNPKSIVQLFAGVDSESDQTELSIKADGSVFVNMSDTGIDFAGNAFGFYLGTILGNYFSDSSLNGGRADHMLAYQGTGDEIQIPGLAPGLWTPGEYALAWEDLPFGKADLDYNDMVLMVSGVTPLSQVPVPAAAWLFASGLIGLIGVARRRQESRRC